MGLNNVPEASECARITGQETHSISATGTEEQASVLGGGAVTEDSMTGIPDFHSTLGLQVVSA